MAATNQNLLFVLLPAMSRTLFVFQNDDSHQNVNYFWHQFSTQFSMLFRMVPSVLLSMVAQISTFWLVEIPQQPIRISQFTGFLSYHGEKKERYRVKEHKKLCWKLMSKMSLHFVGGHHSEKQTVSLVFSCKIREVKVKPFSKPFVELSKSILQIEMSKDSALQSASSRTFTSPRNAFKIQTQD